MLALHNAIEKNQAVMSITFKDFLENYQFIKRFTFKNI